jgi:exonuclease V gamma subunit
LRLTLPGPDVAATDLERFALSPKDRGLLRHLLVQRILTGRYDPSRELQRFLADGLLPPGALGRAIFKAIAAEVEPIRARVAGLSLSSASVLIQGTGWHLRGTLDGLTSSDRIILRAGRYRAKHRIRAWVEHVVLRAAAQSGQPVPQHTILIGTKTDADADGTARHLATQATAPMVADPIALLDQWVQTVREARTRPLPFFPQAGAAWLDSRRQGKAIDHLAVARKEFADGFNGSGDESDPYVALCFREDDPLTAHRETFERLATTLCPTFELPDLA